MKNSGRRGREGSVLAVLAGCLLLVTSVHGAGSSLTIILPEVQRQALVGQYSHSIHQFHSLHVASQQLQVLIVNFRELENSQVFIKF